MRKENFQSLINYRLEQAREAMEDAELLLNAGRHRAVANRLYYACFYTVVAALLTRRLQYSKHAAVIAFFDREFIRSGQLPKEYSRTLHRAFNERQQDDYMPFVEMDADEIESLFVDVRNLVNGISEYIAGLS
ncbi:MAG TPA: HEPN domain-containing protein [Sedimentisphaerales bacterium]|nr:HEPN domain-containing protein [Sedimentisphaerales bacterium]